MADPVENNLFDDTSDVTPVEDRMGAASDLRPVEDPFDEATDFMSDLLFHQLDSMGDTQRMETFHPQELPIADLWLTNI